MSKAEQYLEMILQTNEWFDKKIEQLKLIENQKESKILIQGKNGEQIEMPEELKKGFYLGIITAIDVLGKFPITFSKPEEDVNDN